MHLRQLIEPCETFETLLLSPLVDQQFSLLEIFGNAYQWYQGDHVDRLLFPVSSDLFFGILL